MPKLSLLLLGLLTSLPVLAQPASPASYAKEVLAKIQQVEQRLAADVRTAATKDWTIQQRMQHYHVPGLSIAVVRNYQIEWAKAYGWADSAQQRPLTTDTRFQAASISKSLNAIGVLTLVQAGKLDLYADINQYLSSWKFPYDSLAKGKKISTANLLSHTAGLSVHGFPGYAAGEPLPTLEQILDGKKPANTQAIRSQFAPGLKFQYSGGGTTISQRLLMDLTNQPYAQYMAERVLIPLDMTSSSFAQPPAPSAPLATGYDRDGKPIPGQYHIYPEQAAAGLWTTPTDLCRYIIDTQLSLQGKPGKVLRPATTRLRLTPYVDSTAALGVFIIKKGADRYFSHGGSNEGFKSIYLGSMTNGNGVVAMVNSDNGAILDEVVNSVAQVYGWEGFYKPVIRQSARVPVSVLDTYVGEYQLTPTFMITVTRENDQLLAQGTGQPKLALLAETPTRFYPEAANLLVEFAPDDAGKVTKLVVWQGSQRLEAKKIK